MNSIITKTPGIHNLEIFLALGLLFCACAIVVYRVYSCFLTLAAIKQGTSAISYIPKSSVQAVELNDIEKKHREEWIQMMQTNPRSYMIHRYHVTGHAENVKLVTLAEAGSTELEVEVQGSGICTIFVGVPSAKIDSLISPVQGGSEGTLPLLSQDRLAQLRQQSLFASDAVRFTQSGKLTFSLESASFCNAFEDRLRIPFLALLVSQSHVELTACVSRSTRFLPSDMHQFLLSHTSADCLRILPVFVQNMEECMICYDLKSDTVILDCRHCCMCSQCIGRLNETRCIVCRQHFTEYLNLPRSVSPPVLV